MRLTIYTDYSLRVLLMLAVAPDRLVTIKKWPSAMPFPRTISAR